MARKHKRLNIKHRGGVGWEKSHAKGRSHEKPKFKSLSGKRGRKR